MHRRDHKGPQALMGMHPVLLAAFSALVFCGAGCSNDMDAVAGFETLGGPSQVLQGAALEYSDDGTLTHRLDAEHMTRSTEEPPIWEVTGGFTLEVLDAAGGTDALLGADRGVFEEETRFLEAQGGVVLRGSEGDTLYTELLFWSADSDRVHTTAPVEVRTPQGTLYGRGLESDARFQRYQILEPTGTFIVDTTRSS